jgi:hypothetical protein
MSAGKSHGILRHVVIGMLVALAGYVLLYWGIEKQRGRRGPWQVTFTSLGSNTPALVIDQPALGITNMHVSFPAHAVQATNEPVIIKFSEARAVPFAVPFGQCVFLDTTFLPGTVTLQVYGHEIELLPRVLIVDGREHRWESNGELSLPRAPDNAERGAGS